MPETRRRGQLSGRRANTVGDSQFRPVPATLDRPLSPSRPRELSCEKRDYRQTSDRKLWSDFVDPPAPRRVEAMFADEASIAAAGRLMAGPLP